MAPPDAYQALIFAGGGNRCVWQAGFWEVVAPELPLRPAIAAATSAGAFMAAVLFSGRGPQAQQYYLQATAANRRNFYPANLWGDRAAFPHLKIFRQGMLGIFDQEAMENLRQGPELRVLMARPPRWAGAVGGVLLGIAAYTLEKYLTGPLHPRLPRHLGFKPEVALAGDCRDGRELTDLILASCSTPPILPTAYRNGGPVIDGGVIDNVPLAALGPGEGPALILLTRRYDPAKLRGHPGRTYIQPSRPVPVGKWDYTNPEGLLAAQELGRRDGRRFLEGGPAALQR